jgi:thymidylate kinase
MAQQDDSFDSSQILSQKRLRLDALQVTIENAGGLTKCPTHLVKDFTKLREEIDDLEGKVSNENLPISDISTHPSDIPASAQFIDRPIERHRLESALRSSEDWVRIVVVKGMGGTGKTALALQVARTIRRNFRKVIWTTANDDQSITLENLLDIILRAVEYPSDQLTMQQRKVKVSELLRKERYLLVLDSFERFGDRAIDEFLAQNDFWPSKVLITTRVIFPEDAYTTELKGLTLQQTKEMLQEVGKSKGISISLTEEEIEELQYITDGLPLAVELIIGQLAQGIALNYVLGTLMRGLTNDGLLEPLFGRSWEILKENDTTAHEIWMSMTFFVSPASEEAIRKINKTNTPEFIAAITYLNRMSLIQPVRDQMGGDEFRYRLHPMARQFLDAKLIESDALEAKKKEIYTAAAAYFMELMEQLGRPGLRAKDYEKLEQDLPNCLATFEWCKSQEENANASKVVENLQHFLFEKGFWNERIKLCSSASEFLQESSINAPESAWRDAFWAGWVCIRQNNYEEARTWLRKAQESLDNISSENIFKVLYEAKTFQLHALIKHGEAVALYKAENRSYESLRESDRNSEILNLFDEANQHHDEARDLLNLYKNNGGSYWIFEEPDYAIALVDSNQGDVFVDMGHWRSDLQEREKGRNHYESAQQLYSKVLREAEESDWDNRKALIAFSSANLGHVEIWLGQANVVLIRNLFDEALSIAQVIGRPHTSAWCYRGYGLIELRLAQSATSPASQKSYLRAAKEQLEKALDIFERLGRQERVKETNESLLEVKELLAD